MPNVPSVTVQDVPADVTLLDVREQDEWDAGHAPEALHIPMGELVERLGELPGDKDVYVICRSGGRSARVAAYLNGNGWDATNVDGGMQSWQAAGKNMVSESQAQPQVI
ncbi:rhodanese-like domain-containing protein [Kibdelosporangium aridum]|uniref:Rhodanese-like domain-containing protein n=1 Tax=Kibdelosporangium aridum TaxID=2030 RepID=A0A428YMC2_KIBAR|nr:rhodanese-like domain-containing protein [Kibdelosporangium aridum]RSM69036.1 rhodanese-like domain-containing protein [Kibdelosporangium aridum]